MLLQLLGVHILVPTENIALCIAIAAQLMELNLQPQHVETLVILAIHETLLSAIVNVVPGTEGTYISGTPITCTCTVQMHNSWDLTFHMLHAICAYNVHVNLYM